MNNIIHVPLFGRVEVPYWLMVFDWSFGAGIAVALTILCAVILVQVIRRAIAH